MNIKVPTAQIQKGQEKIMETKLETKHTQDNFCKTMVTVTTLYVIEQTIIVYVCKVKSH